MSGFHIVLCMIQTIYSRFKYAGIVERLSAARLGGKWSIIKALKGGDKKETVYLYKFFLSITLVQSRVLAINITRMFGVTSALGRACRGKYRYDAW